jgi:hypothetical protein
MCGYVLVFTVFCSVRFSFLCLSFMYILIRFVCTIVIVIIIIIFIIIIPGEAFRIDKVITNDVIYLSCF